MSENTATSLGIKKFRVLIAGYINLNVIDGSAFFLSGLARLCADEPNVEVVLLAANPIERTEVIREVLHYPNITVVDPFDDAQLINMLQLGDAKALSREEYARAIGVISERFECDALLVRDTETCIRLVDEFPTLSQRLAAYLTGITKVDKEIPADVAQSIEYLHNRGVQLVCQTPLMAEKIISWLPESSSESVFVLPPQVPDTEADFESVYHFADAPNRLAFTSKFFKDWNADKIFSAFKAINRSIEPQLLLEVAGDQFRRSEADPKFVENVKYLLLSTDGLKWHGRVTRDESRNIIIRSHAGISWRSSELDDSAELSTKVLEYGSLGRPSILNRTKLHEALLGEDYPLFANSSGEFKSILRRLPGMSDEVELAARRCFELAQSYTFSSIRPGFMSMLGNIPDESATVSVAVTEAGSLALETLPPRVTVSVDGMWVNVYESSDAGVSPRVLLEEISGLNKLFVRQLKEGARSLRSQRDSLLTSSNKKDEVSAGSQIEASNEAPTDKLLNIMKTLENAQTKLKEKEREIQRLEKKLSDSEGRLRALRNSKLGKIQVRLWERRAK